MFGCKQRPRMATLLNVYLSLPDPERWSVELSMRPNEYLRKGEECLPEPLTASRLVYGSFAPDQANAIGFPGQFQKLRIRMVDTESDIWTGLGLLDRVQQIGIPLEGGFKWFTREPQDLP